MLTFFLKTTNEESFNNVGPTLHLHRMSEDHKLEDKIINSCDYSTDLRLV